MKDRTPTYPGRIKLTPVEGSENTYDLTWADEPVQVGTPLNKATLLSDAAIQNLRITLDDPTVSDAFNAGLDLYAVVTVSERMPTAEDAKKAGDLWVDKNNTNDNVYISLPDGEGGLAWYAVHTNKRTVKTVVFTTSQVWDVPIEAQGQPATVHIYGGGGSGVSTKCGGGGGYMSVWTGTLTQSSYTITVGDGGTSQYSNANGGAGGASSFGNVASASGGEGGSYHSAKGGSGGSGGGGGYSIGTVGGDGGEGVQFGGGGAGLYNETAGTPGTGKTGTPSAPYYDEDLKRYVSNGGDGVDTSQYNIAAIGKGTGRGGSCDNGYSNAVCGGGGGGYGGAGGAGGQSAGGGGGYGLGNYGAGGDGVYKSTDGKSGIVVVMYWGW